MNFRKFIISIFILFLFTFYFSNASELQKYIPILSLEYPDSLINSLMHVEESLKKDNNKELKSLEKIIQIRTEGYLWVNGFILEDENKNGIIVTQGDMINEVKSVGVVVILGKKVIYLKNVPVVFVDRENLITIIKLPDRIRKYVKSFKLGVKGNKKDTPIIVAGYYSERLKPVWKVLKGFQISGSSFDIDLPGEGKYLIHSVLPNFIEEGEPVLIKNEKGSFKYSVIGVNIKQRDDGTNMAIAMPADEILKAIEKYKRSIKIQRSSELLEKELRKNIKLFQYVVNSDFNDDIKMRVLGYLISYNFAFEHGIKIMKSYSRYFLDRDDNIKLFYDYVMAPTLTLKNVIIDRFGIEIRYNNPSNLFNFNNLDLKDKMPLTLDKEIESYFNLSNRKLRINWIFEQGTWKISDFGFSPVKNILEYNKIKTRNQKRILREKTFL